MFSCHAINASSAVHTNTAENSRTTNAALKKTPYSRKFRAAENNVIQLTNVTNNKVMLDYVKQLEMYIARNQIGVGMSSQKNSSEFNHVILRERISKFGKAIRLALADNGSGATHVPACTVSEEKFYRVGTKILTKWAKHPCCLDAHYYATALRSVDSEVIQATLATSILKKYLTEYRHNSLNVQA
ncbi:hypothetical protein SJI19_04695 [Acerihabitans sp. TG2]|uniref:hypothetical protein n=1 Tax=Acerihabitans sp. TG2 TaxID=3096008 RepID=UPI002B22F6E9|nr:hypothetical protein [Acerihabitans sp. TG2]MEA9389857.1 hypothetical protein [Acerihabitans sp. TG2]